MKRMFLERDLESFKNELFIGARNRLRARIFNFTQPESAKISTRENLYE